jgi:uncharacterized protein (DUF427 family)
MSTSMQEVLADVRARFRHLPIERRVRAQLGPDTIVDSTRAILVWEPGRISPVYAVPDDDIHAELAPAPATNGHVDGVLHPGIPFSVHTAPGRPLTVDGRDGAGYVFADDELAGYVALDFAAFDWHEEDEPIKGHPRDPYHRVDIRRSSRPVRIELDGEVLAATTNARLVCETQLPMRFYLPRDDILAELRPGTMHSHCPYKGDALYWSFDVGGRRVENLAWSYERPYADVTALTGLVSFWDERVDVFLDGEQRPPLDGPIATALRKEFGV